VSLIPGLCAVASIVFLVKEKGRKPEVRNPWRSVQSLPPDFLKFLVPVGLFGISNFAPTLLILRAQELLAPSLGQAAAGAFAAGLYTFSNVAYALVGYPVGVLADKFSKRTILSIGFASFGFLCLGFVFVGDNDRMLIALFALSGIYTAIVESSQPALASMLIPNDLHGTGFGVMSSIDGLGDFLSSVTMGFLWSALSPNAGFAVASTLALLSAVVLRNAAFSIDV
jgi:MFS family permease